MAGTVAAVADAVAAMVAAVAVVAVAVAMIEHRAGNQRANSSFGVQQFLLHSNQSQLRILRRSASCCGLRGTPRLFFMPVKEPKAEKPTYAVGDRVDKFCAKCQEERGHIV